MKSFSKQWTILCFVALALVAAAPLMAQPEIPCNSCSTVGCSKVKMTVTVPGEPPSVTKIPWIESQTVLAAMASATGIPGSSFSYVGVNSCPFGIFITTIDGFAPTGNSYWELQLNGQVAQLGAATQPLQPNDRFNWSVQTFGLEDDSGFKAVGTSHSHQRLMHLDRLKKAAE